MKKQLITLLLGAGFSVAAGGQVPDTVRINPSALQLTQLREGTSRYLVYFKMKPGAPRSNTQFWTRTTEKTQFGNRPAIRITQEWEDKDSVMHTTRSWTDAQTGQTLRHESWWKTRGSSVFDLTTAKAEVNGHPLSPSDTARNLARIREAFEKAVPAYSLNWHNDLEVFSWLPYQKGRTFMIPYYDPGGPAPQEVAYTVTGEATLRGYDDQPVPCWLLLHESTDNREQCWISQTTKEVLRLEQVVKGTMYRYKIKLGFSD